MHPKHGFLTIGLCIRRILTSHLNLKGIRESGPRVRHKKKIIYFTWRKWEIFCFVFNIFSCRKLWILNTACLVCVELIWGIRKWYCRFLCTSVRTLVRRKVIAEDAKQFVKCFYLEPVEVSDKQLMHEV